MAEEYSVTAKVYPTAEHDKFSILNMLEYFEKHGALRVSDLHIKVGTPPAYRVDGSLVKLKCDDRYGQAAHLSAYERRQSEKTQGPAQR